MSVSNNTGVRLWLSRCPPAAEGEHRSQLLSRLSESEQARLQRIGSERKRQEYLTSRALLRHALAADTGQHWTEFSFTETGALPRIDPLPAEHRVSLSHSRGLIGVAVAPHPVGLDIEWLGRAARPELQRYINSDEDRDLLQRCRQLRPEERFAYSWSLREAWYKADPSHQTQAVSGWSLHQIRQSGWSSCALRLDNHLCVLALPHPCPIEIYYCHPLIGQRPIHPEIRPIL